LRLPLALLAALCGLVNLPALQAAEMQAPGLRMMPDGSRDLYVGLGVASRPLYTGAARRKTEFSALLQMQWSNGIFVSGSSLGMHLSQHPAIEFGPLLSLEPGRDTSGAQKPSWGSGLSGFAGGVQAGGDKEVLQQPLFTDIDSTLVGGGFLNYNLDRNLRLTSSLLYGAGNDRNGMLANLGVQKLFSGTPMHHRLSVALNATWVNRNYNEAYFGFIPAAGATRDLYTYRPSSGLRDVQATLNWNWELDASWLLTTQFSVSRLMGSAARSPLVERRNTTAFRTGIAYRF
jgi:outer membrane scaffolding protein for murein synthesis (MipA/OmpV family)